MNVRRLLEARDQTTPVFAPIVQRHAARLEQLAWMQLLTDAELLARALRTAHGLYGLDVLVAGAPALVSWACRTAAAPGLSPAGANAQRGPLDDLPDPQAVADQPLLATLIDGLQRTRSTIGPNAGIGLVVPSVGSLAEQLARPDAAEWCYQVLICVLGRVGTVEPELVVQVGEDGDPANLEPMCRFFGATIVRGGATPSDGVVALSPDAFDPSPDALRGGGTAPPSGWLYTTLDELPDALDPRSVHDTFTRLRARSPIANGART